MSLELSILDSIQARLQCDLLDAIMPVITRLGDGGTLWIVSTAALLLIPKTRRVGAAMAVGLALEALCCNLLLKPMVARVRPCDVNTAFSLLVPRPTDYGFPSGHTGASFAAVSALYFRRSWLWIPAFVLAALISLSRLYLYVHYPSDVLAGALVGIVLGWVGHRIVRQAEGGGRLDGHTAVRKHP